MTPVQRTVQIFKSFAEATAADMEYYRSLSPAQRLDIMLFLREHCSPYSDELTHSFKRVCRIIKLGDLEPERAQGE